MRILTYIQNLDRRILYLMLAVVVGVTLFTGWINQRPAAKPSVQDAYETVQSLQGTNKMALISIYWGAGTIGENLPQTEAVLRHLFKLNVPVAIVPWDQTGAGLVYEKARDVAKEMHKVYGTDWVMFGYNPAWGNVVPALGSGLPNIIKKDKFNTPTSKIEMFRGKTSIKNIGLIVEITPSATLNYWVSFVGQPYHIPIIYCPTGVMAPEGYNFLDAHLISGMLPGVIGAAQYETLLKTENGFATRAANALSVSHIMILILIVLGNVGYLMQRRQGGGA